MPDLTEQEQQVVVAMVEAHARAMALLTTNLTALVFRMFRSFSGWYDDRATRGLSRRVSHVVLAAQLQVALATAAYLEHVWAILRLPRGETVRLPDLLRLADPIEVYERPVREFRRLRVVETPGEDPDLTVEEAAERAAERAVTIVERDLGLAMREAARQKMANTATVIGYRRIIHPELSRSGTCGLCIVAADRVYEKGELLPMHENCKCTVLPVTEDADPGLRMNAEDLRRLYDEAGGNDAAALKRTRYKVVEHGELGPTLVEQGRRIRSGRQAILDARDPAQRALGELAVLEPSLEALERRAARGEDVTAPMAWQRSRVEALRRLVA